MYNMQMLESAYYKLPQPKDLERTRSYTPRHPTVTPPSYPQSQTSIVNNPAFSERLSMDSYGTEYRYLVLCVLLSAEHLSTIFSCKRTKEAILEISQKIQHMVPTARGAQSCQ
ncbi:hypothetical protein QYF36_023016 [Acer negundo]|nr:hypothetical protein QYF36_023016 [Acer negundo]